MDMALLQREAEMDARAPADEPSAITAASEPAARIPLLYVTGYGRSGSTLLDIALGQHPKVMGMGEVTALARHVWDENEYCACGAQVRRCCIWSAIVERWRAGSSRDRVAAYRAAVEGSESILPFGRLFGRLDRSGFAALTMDLLRNAVAVSGRPVLLDSSKLPGRGGALARLAEVDLFVIHLVRDGRGVAWSMARRHRRDVARGLQKEQRGKPLLYTALRWAIVNIAADRLCSKVGSARSVRVRYEDFVADPKATLDGIVAAAGLAPLPSETTETLVPQHQVAGSRHRMAPSIRIAADDKWRSEMPGWKRRVLTLPLAPLLVRYGYRLRAA